MLFAIVSGICIIATLIGLDIWFAVDKIPENTWSEMIRKMAVVTNFIPWVCGVLGGHFFHPNWEPLLKVPANIALLVWLSIIVTVAGMAVMKSNWQYSYVVPFITYLLAAFVGGKLWPV